MSPLSASGGSSRSALVRADLPQTPVSPPGELARHAIVALAAGVLVAGFWFGRMDWEITMRTWRAFGDAGIVLLFVSLAVGPLARLWRPGGRFLRWRREAGVWFAITSLVHTALVLDGWTQWDVGRLLGYEFIPQLGRVARLEPGFGLANLVGLVAVAWAIVLTATSTNVAVRFLGASAWKWVHHGAYVIFYLAVLHAAYFLFLHYTLSFHREPPPANWFRWPLVAMGLAVAVLQWAAFAATVRRRRARPVGAASAGRTDPSGSRPRR